MVLISTAECILVGISVRKNHFSAVKVKWSDDKCIVMLIKSIFTKGKI